MLIVILRLIHIVLGAVWVGMAVFTAVFLGPAMQDAGPQGGKVMEALVKRGMMTAMPILALGTILSGIWLYWMMSAGFQPSFVHSRLGLALGLGGLMSILGFGLGITVTRPAMVRIAAITQGLATATESERAQQMNEIARLRARGTMASKVGTVLLVLATAAMAVARYI